MIAEVEPDLPTNRLNDGVVDPAGRLWFGTMDDGEKAKTGAFYCFAEGRLTRTAIDNIAITNGPAVSPDGRQLYLVDTLKGTIECAEIGDDGTLGEPQAFVRIGFRRLPIAAELDVTRSFGAAVPLSTTGLPRWITA